MASFQPLHAQIPDLLHVTNCMVVFPLQVLKSKSQLGFYSRHIFPVPMNFNVTVTKPSTPPKKSANKIHPPKYNRKSASNQHFSGDLLVFGGVYTSKYLTNNYMENKLLGISINYPENQPQLPKIMVHDVFQVPVISVFFTRLFYGWKIPSTIWPQEV